MIVRQRYANCPCPGQWNHKLARWVVLERLTNQKFLLKCLDCGWKWKSKRKYAAKLPLHVEESRKGMTDADILERLKRKNLRIDPVTCVVESNLKGGWKEIVQIGSSHEDGYRFVSICWRGKKKKIAVHRLQWMAHTLELIPDGYDVDHVTAPPRPMKKNNALSNLRLKEITVNRSYWGIEPGDYEPF